MKKILITDTLFISADEEKELQKHNFEIIRLDKVCASEDEIIEKIKDAHGYILGGIEKVTKKVIDNAPKLQAIVFTGAGYKEFIPCYQYATEKGIAISNAPGGNASAVAEYALILALSMTRNIFSLGRTGASNFKTTKSLSGMSIGIIGLGNIGIMLAKNLTVLGVKDIRYYSRTRHYEYEEGFSLYYDDMSEIFRRCDLISIHVSKDAGEDFISQKYINSMKKGAILINTSYPKVVDQKALLDRLKTGEISAAFDSKPEIEAFNDLSLENWFCSNMSTAFNTEKAISTVSQMASRSIISLLESGDDYFLINPEYKRYNAK